MKSTGFHKIHQISCEIHRILWIWAFGWSPSIGLSFERPKKINASLRAVPVYQKHLGRAGAWNIFQNNFEEYATTNETDFMGSVTMSPASGRQKTQVAAKLSITLISIINYWTLSHIMFWNHIRYHKQNQIVNVVGNWSFVFYTSPRLKAFGVLSTKLPKLITFLARNQLF